MYTRQPKQLQSKSAGPNTRCQKCLKFGHHTYTCSNPRPYQARPSRTQQLEKGKFGLEGPSVEVPEEFKKDAKVGLADRILQAKEEERKRLKALEDKKSRKASKGKAKETSRRKDESSDSDSDSASDSDSDSDSGSDSTSSSRSRSPVRGKKTRRDSSSRSRSPPPRRRPRSSTLSKSPAPRRRRSSPGSPDRIRDRSRSPIRRERD